MSDTAVAERLPRGLKADGDYTPVGRGIAFTLGTLGLVGIVSMPFAIAGIAMNVAAENRVTTNPALARKLMRGSWLALALALPLGAAIGIGVKALIG